MATRKGHRWDFDARFAKLVRMATALRGIVYRSTGPTYANSSDLLSGVGSRINGARWNPIVLAAVYGSLSPRTALEEALAHTDYYQLPIHSSMPRTFVAIEYMLEVVLDLTHGRIRQAVGKSERRLLNCDWRAEMQAGTLPLTQQVGQAASNAGLEAILCALRRTQQVKTWSYLSTIYSLEVG